MTINYKIMPVNLAKSSENIGRIIYQWQIQEYEKYDRNKKWYLMMGLVGSLLLLYAIVTANYVFALIVILFGMVLFLNDMQEPIKLPFTIVETGIVVGNKYYKFSELSNFWIIYNPPAVKNLYFSTSKLINHRIQIPLLNYDPRPIREYLSKFLKEDLEQEEEPMSDRIARIFLLH